MISELTHSLDHTLDFIRNQVMDLTDEEMLLQPAGINNHAAWTVGHVIYSCRVIAIELGANSSMPEGWESRFGEGSQPDPDPSDQVTREAMLNSLEEAGQLLRTSLQGFSENSLGEPLPDERAREFFPSTGHALVQVVAGHLSYHAGQLGMWRRAIGKSINGMFL